MERTDCLAATRVLIQCSCTGCEKRNRDRYADHTIGRACGKTVAKLWKTGVRDQGLGIRRSEKSGRDESAFAETEDAVAAAGEVEVVGDQDAGQGVLAVQLLQQGEDALGGAGVEVAGGLVG
jgi:hypothetical protein